jgi:hypothetical protein
MLIFYEYVIDIDVDGVCWVQVISW